MGIIIATGYSRGFRCSRGFLVIDDLQNTLPQKGRLHWIGVRPSKNLPMQEVTCVQAKAGQGLIGDRYRSTHGKRQVTLIQWEHLAVIAAHLHLPAVFPEQLRRNLAVTGINLLALKGRQFYIGNVLMEYTGLCDPCSAMEKRFGPGGYNAVIGHGGITARILSDGILRINDEITVFSER